VNFIFFDITEQSTQAVKHLPIALTNQIRQEENHIIF